MKDKIEFYSTLKEIDGREISELSRLIGDYDFNRFVVKVSPYGQAIEDTQFQVVVRITHQVAGFPASLISTPIRRTALEDLLTRKLSEAIQGQATFDAQGVARKRIVAPKPGQKILPRSTIHIADDYTDIRLDLLVPIQRGRIDGEAFQTVFFDDLPMVVQESLLYCNMNAGEVDAFISLMEDADHIRQTLPSRGLIGFIGSGSMLNRQPGTDLPEYESEQSISVESSMQIVFDVPHAGTISGLGISTGITLILGDAFSGRVELMQSLASGIYNHIPGDGREYVITMPDTVYVASEPGRSVQRVDLGCFIGISDYSAKRADACHAQAASLIEALEAGARVLLLDEADSCAGFLGSDDRIQGLLNEQGPGVSLAARVKELTKELGVSTVVAGHSTVSAFIPVADTILAVKNGVIMDITREAKSQLSSIVQPEAPAYDFTHLIETARWIIPSSIDSSSGRKDSVIKVSESGDILFGRYKMDVGGAHQLAETQQALTIGLIIEYARQRYLDQPRPMRELLDLVERDLSTEGLEQITRELRGDLVRPRRYEIAAALNRLPSLRVSRGAL